MDPDQLPPRQGVRPLLHAGGDRGHRDPHLRKRLLRPGAPHELLDAQADLPLLPHRLRAGLHGNRPPLLGGGRQWSACKQTSWFLIAGPFTIASMYAFALVVGYADTRRLPAPASRRRGSGGGWCGRRSSGGGSPRSISRAWCSPALRPIPRWWRQIRPEPVRVVLYGLWLVSVAWFAWSTLGPPARRGGTGRVIGSSALACAPASRRLVRRGAAAADDPGAGVEDNAVMQPKRAGSPDADRSQRTSAAHGAQHGLRRGCLGYHSSFTSAATRCVRSISAQPYETPRAKSTRAIPDTLIVEELGLCEGAARRKLRNCKRQSSWFRDQRARKTLSVASRRSQRFIVALLITLVVDRKHLPAARP